MNVFSSVPVAELSDKDLVSEIHNRRDLLLAEISKQIVGQTKVIEELLICLFSGGHALLVGVPGSHAVGYHRNRSA